MLLKRLPVHFRNAPHKHNFTWGALNNRIATVASSDLYWVYGRGWPNCHVKGEAAALLVR